MLNSETSTHFCNASWRDSNNGRMAVIMYETSRLWLKARVWTGEAEGDIWGAMAENSMRGPGSAIHNLMSPLYRLFQKVDL